MRLEIDKFYYLTVLLFDYFLEKRIEYNIPVDLFMEIGFILTKSTYLRAKETYEFYGNPQKMQK